MSKSKTLGSGLEAGAVKRARDKGLDAARQPGSGVYREYPHDVRIERLLGECKVRTASVDANGRRYFPLDIEWQRACHDDARKAGYEAGVTILRPKGDARLFAVCEYDWLLTLLARLKELEGLVAER